VRLAGSGLPYEGRLEVYYNGIWGTVCDDLFDDTDAMVACYSLGFGSANYYLDGSQEAQLSQRDRAIFRVIEYIVLSLKITQGYSKRHS